jgi:hypothetical protein
MFSPLEPSLFRMLTVVVLSAVFIAEVRCDPNWPRAGSLYLYLSRFSLWEKTVTTAIESGVANVVSTYSYGSKMGNSGLSYSTTRHYNSGIVTYSSVWIQSQDNYSETPAFQAPYLPGWTITSNVRYGASFALDYEIPSSWNGHLEIELDLTCQPVDRRGKNSGKNRRKYYEFTKGAGQSGRLFISPYSQSRTLSKNSTVYYYLHN